MNQFGELPEWIDFEMEQQEPQFDLAPLTGALKQRRLRNAPTGGIGTSLGDSTGHLLHGGTSNNGPLLRSTTIEQPTHSMSKGMKSL